MSDDFCLELEHLDMIEKEVLKDSAYIDSKIKSEYLKRFMRESIKKGCVKFKRAVEILNDIGNEVKPPHMFGNKFKALFNTEKENKQNQSYIPKIPKNSFISLFKISNKSKTSRRGGKIKNRKSTKKRSTQHNKK